MMDNNTVIEGTVKFRDGKKWKSRWCVMRKLSPVADCLHLQLYRDSKDRYKQGQTKASLSLEHFLGVESGFTLDKESNTIAIICQDVTVILAFDSRERLIQWQVKISNNLGEDQQFLIQISSAPPKAKIASGPARLHVQDQRFCITLGVPPRLVGFWEIGQLRRYGVAEGRFCFEGGSRCGKGEGLHVCVTDQGEEITHTFQLAAQGKLTARRRPVTRKMSAMDSPRKQLHSRTEVRISDLSCAESHQHQHQRHLVQLAPGDLTHSLYAEDVGCCCSMADSMLESSRHLSSEDLLCPCRVHSSSPFWSSAESSGHHHADLDSNYGCGDTSSVSELQDQHYHQDAGWADCERRPGPTSLERCASCIGKLGAPSMSRSSTATNNTNTPNTPFSPAWTMDAVAPGLPPVCGHLARCAVGDRMSLSSHGSAGSGSNQSSEYSVPHFANPAVGQEPCWYDKPRATPPAPPVVPPKSAKSPVPHAAAPPPAAPGVRANPAACHPTSLPIAAAHGCRCCPPARPPKPPQMSSPASATTTTTTDSPTKKKAKKPPMPLPVAPAAAAPSGRWLPPVCTCHHPTLPPPPMNLQHHQPAEAAFGVGPYENYDVPKSVLGRDHNNEQLSRSVVVPQPSEEYYDTPKSLKECLVASGCDVSGNSPYGNYDTPPVAVMMKKSCGCVVKYSKKTMVLDTAKVIVAAEERASSAVDCPCRRVMCWAENFMMIPYCRRGNGMENTGVPIHKVKLSGEGKMPVVNSKGEIAIYATIDKSKKTNRKLQLEREEDCSRAADAGCESQTSANYVNVAPAGEDRGLDGSGADAADGVPPGAGDAGLNYENIEFAQSLEYYENSRDVLSRAGITLKDLESVNALENPPQRSAEHPDGSVTYTLCNGVKFCNKCGHACHYFPSEQPPPDPGASQSGGGGAAQGAEVVVAGGGGGKQDDYLMMEPGKNVDPDKAKEPDHPARAHSSRNFPGYLPMSPITNAANKAEVLKMMSKSLATEKSASSPSLTVPAGDRSRKRSNSEFPRVPGSAMMMNHSANSPYMRRMLFESSDDCRREYLMSRKRSSSADSSRYLDDFEDVENVSVAEDSVASSHETRNVPQDDASGAPEATETIESKTAEITPCIHSAVVQQSDEAQRADDTSSQEVDNPPEDLVPSAADRTSVGECVVEVGVAQQPHGFKTPSAIHIRRSSSVPCKSGNNRDSSSSNDSGVSTDSLRHRGADFAEFELPLTTAMSARRHYHAVARNSSSLGNCLHASLPRRSKSVDPLRELTFQFQKVKIPAKSSSAEAEVPICPTKGSKGFASPGADGAIIVPYIDSRSTSSGTSDMSDYIETLSLSSHSSSDTPGDSLRLGRPATTTLRPRSGKEYQLIDRSVLEADVKGGERSASQLRSLSQYANITPLLEKSESPSPGYMSGSPGQERDEQPLAVD